MVISDVGLDYIKLIVLEKFSVYEEVAQLEVLQSLISTMMTINRSQMVSGPMNAEQYMQN